MAEPPLTPATTAAPTSTLTSSSSSASVSSRPQLVHSMTFTSPELDPSSRFLGGREAQARQELKRREALWDLFQSEVQFLLDHLMVLKHVSQSVASRLSI